MQKQKSKNESEPKKRNNKIARQKWAGCRRSWLLLFGGVAGLGFCTSASAFPILLLLVHFKGARVCRSSHNWHARSASAPPPILLPASRCPASGMSFVLRPGPLHGPVPWLHSKKKCIIIGLLFWILHEFSMCILMKNVSISINKS